MQRVDGKRVAPGNQQRPARDVELLEILVREARGPGHPGRDVDGGRRETDRGKCLRHVVVREVLGTTAADIEGAPGELLREVQIRRDRRRDLPGVERVALHERPVRRVVDVSIERRLRIDSLRVVTDTPSYYRE